MNLLIAIFSILSGIAYFGLAVVCVTAYDISILIPITFLVFNFFLFSKLAYATSQEKDTIFHLFALTISYPAAMFAFPFVAWYVIGRIFLDALGILKWK